MRHLRPNYTSRHFTALKNIPDPPASFPIKVETYSQLVRKAAIIANVNHTQTLYYRGQVLDYKNKAGKTSLYPEIYRGDHLSRAEVRARFEVLESAETQLIDTLPLSMEHNKEDLRRRKFVRWAILQHYNVCATPFLDLTHSLHVACSFATHKNDNDYGYVYVLGLGLPDYFGHSVKQPFVN